MDHSNRSSSGRRHLNNLPLNLTQARAYKDQEVRSLNNNHFRLRIRITGLKYPLSTFDTPNCLTPASLIFPFD
jgi:hypothetical protein